jgi:hypothetical protein
MSGEDWMRNIGQAMDLGMKAYGVANAVAPLLGSGGQSVVPGAAQLAADKGADAVVAAQDAGTQTLPNLGQQAMDHARRQDKMESLRDMGNAVAMQGVPAQNSMERYMSAVDGVNSAKTMEQLQAAQAEAQAAEAALQWQERDQQFTAPGAMQGGMSLAGRPQTQTGMSLGQPNVGTQFDLSPFDQTIQDRELELREAAATDYSGQRIPQPQAPQAVALTELPTETLRQLQVDFANDQERLKIVQDELRRRSSGVEGGGKQQSALQALEAAEAAVPQEMAEFATLADAQTALAMAASSGDRQAWKEAVDNMANSPLSDVRPQNLQDAIFGTHVERAKRALIAKYPAPKAMTGMDALKAADIRSRIGKRSSDVERDQYNAELKTAKHWRDDKLAELKMKFDKKKIKKLEYDTKIAKVKADYAERETKAAIRLKRATAWHKGTQARENIRRTKLLTKMQPELERALLNKAWAPEIAADKALKLAQNLSARQQDRLAESLKRASTRGKAQGSGSTFARKLIDAYGALAAANKALEGIGQPEEHQKPQLKEKRFWEAKKERAKEIISKTEAYLGITPDDADDKDDFGLGL